jgi:hypothetical protein
MTGEPAAPEPLSLASMPAVKNNCLHGGRRTAEKCYLKLYFVRFTGMNWSGRKASQSRFAPQPRVSLEPRSILAS